MKDVTAPGLIALGLPAVYWVNCKLGAALCKLAVFHSVISEIPAPVRVIPVITVDDPGLLIDIVRLDVAPVEAEAVTPPYSVADDNVIVSTFEPTNPIGVVLDDVVV